jgi:hypothetical protein
LKDSIFSGVSQRDYLVGFVYSENPAMMGEIMRYCFQACGREAAILILSQRKLPVPLRNSAVRRTPFNWLRFKARVLGAAQGRLAPKAATTATKPGSQEVGGTISISTPPRALSGIGSN